MSQHYLLVFDTSLLYLLSFLLTLSLAFLAFPLALLSLLKLHLPILQYNVIVSHHCTAEPCRSFSNSASHLSAYLASQVLSVSKRYNDKTSA